MASFRDQTPAGLFVGRVHHFPLRVYFEDTDLSGMVYHANYLKFMERARSDMLARAGVDQRAALEDGAGVYAVADLSIAYKRPARLDDALIVVSACRDVRGATVRIHQRVMRENETLTDARVTAAFLGRDGRPKRQPRAWVEAFERLIEKEDS